MNSQLIFDVGR